MAHQVESMFFVGETPWHGLGHHFQDPPKTLEEILPAAGLDWQVIPKPIFSADGKAIDGYQQLCRSDNGYSLSVMGSRYVPMQNAEAFSSLMPLIESGQAEIETAGSLKNGSKVWALLRSGHLTETVLANGERIKNFFLWSTSHDGSRANRFGKTSVRVVCANTLSASDGDSAVTFRHTVGQKAILDTLVGFATTANQENERMGSAFNLLLNSKIKHTELETYIKQVMNLADSTRAKNIITDIAGKASFGRGNADVRGTWWAALNAITEHLSHNAGRTAENRYASLWFGPNQGLLNKASTIAIQAVS